MMRRALRCICFVGWQTVQIRLLLFVSRKVLYPIVFYQSLNWLHFMPKNTRERENLTIKTAAEYSRVTGRRIYRLAAAKNTLGFKVYGTWRFRCGELDQWISAALAR